MLSESPPVLAPRRLDGKDAPLVEPGAWGLWHNERSTFVPTLGCSRFDPKPARYDSRNAAKEAAAAINDGVDGLCAGWIGVPFTETAAMYRKEHPAPTPPTTRPILAEEDREAAQRAILDEFGCTDRNPDVGRILSALTSARVPITPKKDASQWPVGKIASVLDLAEELVAARPHSQGLADDLYSLRLFLTGEPPSPRVAPERGADVAPESPAAFHDSHAREVLADARWHLEGHGHGDVANKLHMQFSRALEEIGRLRSGASIDRDRIAEITEQCGGYMAEIGRLRTALDIETRRAAISEATCETGRKEIGRLRGELDKLKGEDADPRDATLEAQRVEIARLNGEIRGLKMEAETTSAATTICDLRGSLLTARNESRKAIADLYDANTALVVAGFAVCEDLGETVASRIGELDDERRRNNRLLCAVAVNVDPEFGGLPLDDVPRLIKEKIEALKERAASDRYAYNIARGISSRFVAALDDLRTLSEKS